MLKMFFAVMAILSTPVHADMATEMLLPSVEVYIGNTGGGSGTAVKVDDVRGTFIMTNYHVVSREGSIKVNFYGEEESYTAFIYSYDKDKDIAVLLTPHKAKNVAALGNAADVQVFDEAYCIGNPHGNGTVPSVGIITGVNYKTKGQMKTRTDCKLAPGNSGGGLYVQRDDLWVYVGMPTAVALQPISTPFGKSFVLVPHLAIAVRIKDILNHLKFYRVLDVPKYGTPF